MEDRPQDERNQGLPRRFIKWGAYVTLGWLGLASIYSVVSPAENSDEPLAYKPEVVQSAQQQGYHVEATTSDQEEEAGDDGLLAYAGLIGGLGVLGGYIAWNAHKLSKENQIIATEETSDFRPTITHEQLPRDPNMDLQFAAITEHIVWNSNGTIRE